MEVKITDGNFDAEVKESKLPVLVDFYADWCGPCKMMAPLVEQLSEEFEGTCKVGKCNVDENPQTASMFRVMSIPTFVLFQDGKAVDTVVGAVSKTALQEKIKQVLA
ncbi:MAG: thioredoxin [Lachnospiraceae bacterium]|nr:thioredoxin [Lachnospiraceae bacterium]MDE7007409.1 thioredoxin [Lachnospiraceae bacterium]